MNIYNFCNAKLYTLRKKSNIIKYDRTCIIIYKKMSIYIPFFSYIISIYENFVYAGKIINNRIIIK